jgi:hypothetical protein
VCDSALKEFPTQSFQPETHFALSQGVPLRTST